MYTRFSRLINSVATAAVHFRAALTPSHTMQRLVQLSQANAKLSSESASARAQLVSTEEASEKARHDLEVSRERKDPNKKGQKA